MLKVFVAYRSSGEDSQQVEPVLNVIRQAFKSRGVDIYCAFFDEAKIKSLGVRQIVDYTFGIIDESDFLFVLQTSDNKSEGMLIEVGYSLSKKIPIILAIKDIVSETYLPSLASQALTWSTTEDLSEGIKGLRL